MTTQNFGPVKGFRDFTGEEACKRAEIKKILVETFEKFGFEPAETPLIEREEFVKGENANDEAVRDIFKLQDRGGRKIALRYEFTFQLNRLAKNQKLPYKRYQIGELFRDEPIREGRSRQFTQCDVDIVGSSLKDETEILTLTREILEKLKIDFTIYFNNRKLLNEILNEQKIKEKDKMQVIREVDKLGKLTEKEIKDNLKKFNAENILDIFKKPESYFKKYKAYSEIEELRKYCDYYKTEIKFSPSLARGLSYYNSTIFEVWAKGLNVSVCGGGSYLINGIQSTGISFGLVPIMILAKLKFEKDNYLIISLGKDKEAIKLAQKLRQKNKSVSIYYGKPSKALEYANSYGIKKVIFVGEDEVKSKKFKVKDMKTGRESLLKI